MSGYSSSVSVGYGGAASSVRSVSVGRRVSGGNKPAFGSTLTLARSEYNGPAPGTTRPRSTSRGPNGGRRIVGSEEVGGTGGMSDAASVGASTRSGRRGDQFPWVKGRIEQVRALCFVDAALADGSLQAYMQVRRRYAWLWPQLWPQFWLRLWLRL